jgi:hypothetical protein
LTSAITTHFSACGRYILMQSRRPLLWKIGLRPHRGRHRRCTAIPALLDDLRADGMMRRHMRSLVDAFERARRALQYRA